MSEIPKSIFKYIKTDSNGIHYIPPERFNQLLKDADYDTSDLEYKLVGEQFPEGLSPMLIITPQKLKSKYNPALKKAIYKYREKHREEYNEISRRSYNNKKQDEEWAKNRKEKQREYNRKYREKLKEEKIAKDPNYVVRGKGRPRK